MPVQPLLAPVYIAAMNGDVEALRVAWRPQVRKTGGGTEDTGVERLCLLTRAPHSLPRPLPLSRSRPLFSVSAGRSPATPS